MYWLKIRFFITGGVRCFRVQVPPYLHIHMHDNRSYHSYAGVSMMASSGNLISLCSVIRLNVNLRDQKLHQSNTIDIRVTSVGILLTICGLHLLLFNLELKYKYSLVIW